MNKQKKLLILCIAAIFILSTALAGCGGSGGGGGGAGGGGPAVTQWSFYSAYGPEDGACSVIWPQLFREIQEKTDGRLVITTFWSGQHPYDPADMLKAVEDGAAHLSHFYSGYLSAVEPIFSLDIIPLMLPTDPDDAWKVMAGVWGNFSGDKSGVLENILQERWGASMVHMIPASPQRFFSIGFDIAGRADMTGYKIRTYSPELAELVQIMGGTPIPLAFAEVYTSLATNLIDGLITSTAFAYSGGFFDYIDEIGMWEIAQGTDGMVVSLDALNALPDDVREIFLTTMKESALKPEGLEIEQNDEIVERLVAEGKVRLTFPPEAEREFIKTQVRERIWAPWLQRTGAEGQMLLDQIDEILSR